MAIAVLLILNLFKSDLSRIIVPDASAQLGKAQNIRYNVYHGNIEDDGWYGTAWTPNPGTGEFFNGPLFIGLISNQQTGVRSFIHKQRKCF